MEDFRVEIVVFIDTNVLNGHPWLEGQVWQDLLRDRHGLDVRVVLSEVVVVENSGMVDREASPALDALRRGQLLGAAFQEHATEQLQTYEKRFRERLRDLEIEVLEPSREHFLGAVKRAAQRMAPALPTSQGKAKPGGTRDATLWLQLVDLARDAPSAQVWMVTNNSSDFGASPDREPAELKQEEAPEVAERWHADLARELKKYGLLDSVYQARQIRTFVQHLDALEAAAADQEEYELPDLTDDLRLQVAIALRTLAAGSTLPSDSLPGVDNVSEITVLDVEIDTDQIILSDVTHPPGKDTWRGNVVVTCPAQILVRTASGDSKRHRRVTVRGLVEVSAGGDIAFSQVAVQLHQTLKETQEVMARRLAPHFEPLQMQLAATDWASGLAAQESESLRRAREAARIAAPNLGEIAEFSKLFTKIGNTPGLATELKRIADSITPPDLLTGFADPAPGKPHTQGGSDPGPENASTDDQQEDGID